MAHPRKIELEDYERGLLRALIAIWIADNRRKAISSHAKGEIVDFEVIKEKLLD